MSALIVGGDRIGKFQRRLQQLGHQDVHHWCGRNSSECHRIIPSDTRLIVIVIDQVNHKLATRVRRMADTRNLPIVFSRRCIAEFNQAYQVSRHLI
ncbi:MAG: DUF2325 domain-containing protein [Candidatus Competibacteraceae bacterium]|nr:DUF2325 domain-containing protein [Candidatus Competibacteraceae bacterium]